MLELNIPGPTDSLVAFTLSVWAGLTHVWSRWGEDLTRTRFVEVWVNDRTQDHTRTHANLHIDLGRVSEDAFWSRNAPPNGRLDTEDKNRDLKLDRNDDPAIDEDTGLDGLHDEEEPGYTGSGDPNGDDYRYTLGSTAYSGINGTERNGTDDVNARPDTEDLNLDGLLNAENDYFEATIDLADSEYVAVDVARDYAGDPDVGPYNGWRLFRVPVEAFRSYGRPRGSSVQHLRLWMDGMVGPTNIQIGGIQLMPIPASELAAEVRMRPSHPNPFKTETVVEFDLPRDAVVRIAIYDVRGRLVRELFHGFQGAGSHQAVWSVEDVGRFSVPSGVYFCRLEAAGKVETRRIVLLR